MTGSLEIIQGQQLNKGNMGSNADERVMEELPTYAPSLPVRNVQEMVRWDPLQVPERYIRDQDEMPEKTNNPNLTSEIPVIDLSLLLSGQEDELQKLDLACKDWGFFQVIFKIQQIINPRVKTYFVEKIEERKIEFYKARRVSSMNMEYGQ